MIKFLFFMAMFGIILIPTEKTITGTVTDENGESIPGVTVTVKGTSIATLTDFEGKYTLNKVPYDAKKLVFSFVGMETKEVKIGSKTEIDVTLEAADVALDEVVVTGLGVKRNHKSVGYASRKIKSSESSLSYSDDVMYYDYDGGESTGKDKGTGYDNQIRSGQLTAGEVNDFGKWEMWQDITKDQLKQYQALWEFYPQNRYCVLLTDEENKPIINADVYLKSSNETIWTAKTDNTGKAELWTNMYDSLKLKKLSIQVDYKGTLNSIDNPKSFHNGINRFRIQAKCDIPDEVDIAFVIDATSSMSDEMSYLQAEILNVIHRIDTTHQDLTVNLASVFYRDEGDDYISIKKDFSKNITLAVDYIKEQSAWGGGDFPEAVDAALDMAVNELKWSDNARAKVLFLVLDAPPHQEEKNIELLQKTIQAAAAKGIRIVPITCSGIDKSTEYLMRSMALATNGTYVFLTDDSGIGGSHIKPTTDKWDVEFLNDLIVRLITQYVLTPTCENEITVDEVDLQEDTVLVNVPDIDIDTLANVDTNNIDTAKITNIDPPVEEQSLKIYPNPTRGDLTIEVTGEISEFFICDMSGKILERHEVDDRYEVKLFIGSYPPGIYFVRYFVGEALKSGKIILMH